MLLKSIDISKWVNLFGNSGEIVIRSPFLLHLHLDTKVLNCMIKVQRNCKHKHFHIISSTLKIWGMQGGTPIFNISCPWALQASMSVEKIWWMIVKCRFFWKNWDTVTSWNLNLINSKKCQFIKCTFERNIYIHTYIQYAVS